MITAWSMEFLIDESLYHVMMMSHLTRQREVIEYTHMITAWSVGNVDRSLVSFSAPIIADTLSHGHDA